MMCVLSSYGISEWLRPVSFFEQLSILRGLDDKLIKKKKVSIKNILEMRPDYRDFEYFALDSVSKSDLLEVVDRHFLSDDPFKLRYVPVVDSHTRKNLLYLVKVPELAEYCKLYFNADFARLEKGDMYSDDCSEPCATSIEFEDNYNPKMLIEMLKKAKLDLNVSSQVIACLSESLGVNRVVNPSARSILEAITHISPPVMYEDSPVSYLVKG